MNFDAPRHPYRLARLADVATPDAPESPGALWLTQVGDHVDESDPEEHPIDIGDAATRALAGDEGGFNTDHEMWSTFVDLEAWRVFDDALDEQADVLGGKVRLEIGSANDVAHQALGVIADRLATALAEERQADAPEDPKGPGEVTQEDIAAYPTYYRYGAGYDAAYDSTCPDGNRIVECAACRIDIEN